MHFLVYRYIGICLETSDALLAIACDHHASSIDNPVVSRNVIYYSLMRIIIIDVNKQPYQDVVGKFHRMRVKA